MANIATLLARILSTRYGNEMRQDLHDAIEAVNDDTETALGKKLTFTTNTRKLKLLAKDDSVLSEVVIPGGGSGGGSVDSVNGLFPDENGNVELNLDDINDVDITSAADGDALVYDATSHKWVNGAGGGGTTDYTDLSNKPSINGVTLNGNKTSADLGLQSELTFTSTPSANNKVVCQNDLPSGGGSNRNLLDNPWFTVNQRGFTSIVSANNNDTTLFDRWKNANGGDTQSSTISLGSSGLTLTQNTTTTNPWQICLDQIMEENVISNKVITFSVLLADGTLIKSSGLFNADIINEYDISTNLKLVYGMWTYNGKVRARIGIRTPQSYSQSASVTIRAVKLELGTESTLALDVAPNYTEELLKCQRYYYPLSGKEFMGFKSSNYEVKVPLPTEMRTTPTISLTGTSIGLTGSSQQGGSISSAIVTVSGNEALVNVGLTMAGGGSDYNVCSAFEIFNLVGYLSAEL